MKHRPAGYGPADYESPNTKSRLREKHLGRWYTSPQMVTALDLAQTLRRRSAKRHAQAEVRTARLRQRLPEAKTVLMQRYHAKRVVLFGSLVTNTYTERSDVDLAVEGMPSDSYFRALADLMTLFGVPVDLVRVEEAVPSLQALIEEE